jgi:hypothetical protein
VVASHVYAQVTAKGEAQMKTLRICYVLCLVGVTALVGTAEIVRGDCDPSYTGGSIAVTSGTLNGQVLSTDDPRAAVTLGALLEGTVNIHVVNNGAPGNVFPVCATTSWGDHAASGWTIDSSHPPGEADFAVPISVSVPEVAGTYYIFFAASWELSCGNVLSCTNWANGTGDVWDDGYDVADWTDDQAQSAIDLGWVCSNWLTGGSLAEFNIPAAAIRIAVSDEDAVEPTIWGRVKALYR